MERSQIEIFIELSKTQSFSKTGEILGFTQANISTQIKHLEEECGGPLFNRLGKKATLTQRGKCLLGYASQIMSLSNEAKNRLVQFKDDTISIVVSESLCLSMLKDIIHSFRQLHPWVNFHISLSDHQAPALLQNGECDLALILKNDGYESMLNILHSKPIQIGFFCSPEFKHHHSLSNPLVLTDLEELPLIFTAPGCQYRSTLEAAFKSQKISPNIILETGSIQVIKEMTLCSLGICFLPIIAVQKEIREHQLTSLDFSFEEVLHARLICHKDKQMSPILQDFIECVKND